MLKLSVQQFVSHLPLEQQRLVLRSQEAFLAFLRREFRRNDRSKRALVEAATAYAERQGVTVHCLTTERYAAKAVVYAYMRLGDELAALGRKVGLTPQDVEALEQVRDTTPAEPLRFE